MKNKKKGVLIAVVVIALIVAAVAAVCINKKAGDSGKLKEGQTETTVKVGYKGHNICCTRYLQD